MAKKDEKKLSPLGRPPSRPMKFSIWYLVIGLLALFVVFNFMGKPSLTTIPYSSFKQWLADGRIKRATVQQEKIVGEAKSLTDSGRRRSSLIGTAGEQSRSS